MTGKALDRAEDILDENWREHDETMAGPVLRAQTSVITSVLNTQAKVDETRLRRTTLDKLPDLLKLVNEVAARLPSAPVRTIDVVVEG